jgi:two-component system response regulator FixJ
VGILLEMFMNRWYVAHSRNGIVYVVDDDDNVRESTIALLKAAGIAARAYASGGEFLPNLAASASGCILLDLHMPFLSGFQVLKALRKHGNRMPVILFSGRADSTTDEIAKQSGAAALLPKPFSPTQLIETVRRLLPAG